MRIFRPVQFMRLPLLSLLSLSLASAACLAQGGAQAPVLSVTDAGRVGNQKLYNMRAENADVVEALKQLFDKLGNYSLNITQEVRGSTVTLNARNETADSLIRQVQNAAAPPIHINTTGRMVYVTRSANAAIRAEQIQRMMDANAGRKIPGIVPGGLQTIGGTVYPSAFYNQVTLNVPEREPISLGEALQRLEKQAGVKISLDRSVPADVKFIGTVTRTPLIAVLQNIAPGTGEAALKMITQGNQVVIAPTDRFTLFMANGLPIVSSQPCAKCAQPLFSSWSFCPGCGQITRRGQLQNAQPSPGTSGAKKTPFRPE